MDKPPAKKAALLTKKRIITLAIFLLLIYIVAPRLSSFSDSFDVAGDARPGYVAVAVVLVSATYLFAAAIYWSLAIRPLRFRPTMLVQIASGFTNRLLPAGLGTLTLYVQYLRKNHHSLTQAVTVTGANSLLGMVGHGLILALVLIVTGNAYPAEVRLPSAAAVWLVAGGFVVVVAANLLVFRKLREYAYRITKEVFGYAWQYRQRPHRLAIALGFSLCLTTTYVAIFYLCALAVGAPISLAQAFLVFTIGMIAATATPTPGGLVGAEAGLTGGLIAYGVHADPALAVALLYRFLTYWLPLLPGLMVFLRIRPLYTKVAASAAEPRS